MLRELPLDLFWDLKSLTSLNLTGIVITNINERMFLHNKHLTYLYFSKFRYCLFAPRVRVCRPYSDGLSSLQNLLVHPILRKAVWGVAFFTCIGNLLVIIWRSMSAKEDEILSLFVQNLSGMKLILLHDRHSMNPFCCSISMTCILPLLYIEQSPIS